MNINRVKSRLIGGGVLSQEERQALDDHIQDLEDKVLSFANFIHTECPPTRIQGNYLDTLVCRVCEASIYDLKATVEDIQHTVGCHYQRAKTILNK